MVALCNCSTSLFAGCVVFATLGFIAEAKGISIADVAQSGKSGNFNVETDYLTKNARFARQLIGCTCIWVGLKYHQPEASSSYFVRPRAYIHGVSGSHQPNAFPCYLGNLILSDARLVGAWECPALGGGCVVGNYRRG